MAVSAVLEAKDRLGQRSAVGQGGEGARKGKGLAPAAWADQPGGKGHGAAWAAAAEGNHAQLAGVAERRALGNEAVASGAASWPQDRNDRIQDHARLSGSAARKLLPRGSESAWRGARRRGTLTELRRRIVKILAYFLAGLVALLGITVLAAILFVQGERLAAIVNGVLPEMKGKLHFGAIRWQPRLLFDLATDRPTPMVVEGLLITDPEGTTVLDVPELQVSVRLRSLIAGGGIILSDLHVGPKSLWVFSKMAKLKGIGFLASFDPKHPAPPPPPPPPGAKKEKGFVFQIVNAELDGFRAIFDFPGVWGLDLRDIHAPASVLIDGDGFVGFDVTSLEARQGGYLKVMTETLPFDSVLVDRVATTREWSDDIFLDLRVARTGRSELAGKGFFTGIYGANSVGGIKVHAGFEHAADALTAVAKPHGITGLRLSGDNAKVVGDLWDPYDTLKIKAAISGLDAGYEAYDVK